jgi:hypothetical protein
MSLLDTAGSRGAASGMAWTQWRHFERRFGSTGTATSEGLSTRKIGAFDDRGYWKFLTSA